MKTLFKKLFCLINKLLLIFSSNNIPLKTNTFFKFRLYASADNTFKFNNVLFEKSQIHITGGNNYVDISDTFVSNTNIRIDGNNNKIIIKSKVKLRSAEIIVRGNNCSIEIGKNTTFGGIRIINVGTDNSILIGEDCLFADYIELWASDSHSIFNSKNEIINKEKPVTIGNKVWVGSKVIILKGVTIEDGSIIGMGSLVVNDVPGRSISVGNPNKIVKEDISWSL